MTWNRCCDHEYGCRHAAALILATYIVGKGGGRGRERGREGERERGREGERERGREGERERGREGERERGREGERERGREGERERGREGERERGREGRKSYTIGKKEEDGKRTGERKREEEEGGHDPHTRYSPMMVWTLTESFVLNIKTLPLRKTNSSHCKVIRTCDPQVADSLQQFGEERR